MRNVRAICLLNASRAAVLTASLSGLVTACGDDNPLSNNTSGSMSDLPVDVELASSSVGFGESVQVVLRPAVAGSFRFVVANPPALGAVDPVSSTDGRFTYTAGGSAGRDRWSILVTDLDDPARSAVVGIDVVVAEGAPGASNAAPRARDATYSVGRGPLTIDLGSISSDPDGPDARFSIVSGPNYGRLDESRLDEGVVVYIPSIAGPASDSFRYRRADGHAQDPKSGDATVFVNIDGSTSKPDLVIKTVTAPRRGAVGETIFVELSVENQGDRDSAPFKVGLYFSTDQSISYRSDVSAASCDLDEGVAAGSVWTCDADITVPSSLTPGRDYYFGAYADTEQAVDESNEDNNGRATSNSIRIDGGAQSSGPDLAVTSVTVPRSARAGSTISVTVEVENIGDEDAGPFRTGFYFSTNAIISTNDTLVRSCNHSQGAEAGETRVCNLDVVVPASLTAGESYYFGAYADQEDVIDEDNELNNARRASHSIEITGGSSGGGQQAYAPADLSGTSFAFSTIGTIQFRSGGYGTLYSTAAGNFGIRYSYVRTDNTHGQVRVWQVMNGTINNSRYDDFAMSFTSASAGTHVHRGMSSIGPYGPISGTFRRVN